MIFRSMITLTYGKIYPLDGKEVKRHLNNVLTWLRRKFDGVEYLWFLEFQPQRGAPHFHIITNIAETTSDVFNLANYWSTGVAIKWATVTDDNRDEREEMRRKMFAVHCHSKTWERVREFDGVARYVTKYATKLEQKKVPAKYSDVGRFWGVSSGVKTPDVSEEPMSEAELRDYLADYGHPAANWDVIPKFLFVFDAPPELDKTD